ncbi:MAG: hypothetical protein IPI67_06780 [Myxococcales bacterium]|nr:hypothetical protein [Myxococcales bacterium]
MSHVPALDLEAAPTSMTARAQARLEAAAECAAIQAKAAVELERIKREQAEELSRAQTGAASSLKRTWIASSCVGVLAVVSLVAASMFSGGPSLSHDGDALASAPVFEPSGIMTRSSARAVRETGSEVVGRPTVGDPARAVETAPGNCNEWDPLAFCLKR